MKNLLKIQTIICLLVGLGWAMEARAQTAQDTEAIADTKTIIKKMDLIQPQVERHNLGRFLVLKKTAQNVLDFVQSKGMGNRQTSNAFYNMSVAFKYSQSYFFGLDGIATENMSHELKDILAAIQRIDKNLGYDESPYAQVAHSILSQVEKLNLQLMKLNIENSFKSHLSSKEHRMDLGVAIAAAKQGDRPRAFEFGGKIYSFYRKLYPQFDKIMASNEAFSIVMELQGLMEFWAEFAQIEERGAP